MRNIGTSIYGIRMPIIKEGDNLENVIVKTILKLIKEDNIILKDKDIIGITESLLARVQGNFVSIDDVARDIKNKYGDEVGVLFPIFSRNRFSLILKSIALGVNKCYVQLNYPYDEVGNPLGDIKKLLNKNINIYKDEFSETDYKNIFNEQERQNPFTKIDILTYYKSLSDNIEIIFSNNPTTILKYTKNVLVSEVHNRFETLAILKETGVDKIYTLDDIMTENKTGGYNKEYGLLGANMATSNTLKLFPRGGESFVNNLQERLLKELGIKVEVLIFGDGAFKDPIAGIWELADPVVSPAYTKGLKGVPHEIKLKYLADNNGLSSEEMKEEIKRSSQTKETLGTTPRRIIDLVGSLCDLTSGSGDKGTPVVLIQGYFDNYASD